MVTISTAASMSAEVDVAPAFRGMVVLVASEVDGLHDEQTEGRE